MLYNDSLYKISNNYQIILIEELSIVVTVLYNFLLSSSVLYPTFHVYSMELLNYFNTTIGKKTLVDKLFTNVLLEPTLIYI